MLLFYLNAVYCRLICLITMWKITAAANYLALETFIHHVSVFRTDSDKLHTHLINFMCLVSLGIIKKHKAVSCRLYVLHKRLRRDGSVGQVNGMHWNSEVQIPHGYWATFLLAPQHCMLLHPVSKELCSLLLWKGEARGTIATNISTRLLKCTASNPKGFNPICNSVFASQRTTHI